MNQRRGLALLVLVAVVIAGYLAWQHGKPTAPSTASGPAPAAAASVTTVKGYVGGEKLGFLADPQVIQILHDKYGLAVDGTKLGSIDMVDGSVPTAGLDFLWPSSQVALELYKEHHGKMENADTIFNSPIVFYSWDIVTQALTKAHVVQKLGATYYVVDAPKLIGMINGGAQWKSIGLPQLYGRISIRSTDPTKSNSGFMFAGLLADIANGGEVADEASLPKTLPTVKTFFSRLGYLEGSSGDLFDQFLKMGEGANPMIVGYENQLTEFSIQNAQYQDLLRKRIQVLYPRPTVYSSHPLIALTPAGSQLLQALHDPNLQKIAWEKHGFRSGLIGVQNDPQVLQVVGIPDTIQNVIPMPRAEVMNKIVQGLAHSE